MAPSPIAELEKQLRRAVVARRYDDVRRIALEFCSAARTAISQLLPGDPLRRETILHVNRTLEWARVMVILARTSLSSDLRRFTFLHKYILNFPANPSATNTRLEA